MQISWQFMMCSHNPKNSGFFKLSDSIVLDIQYFLSFIPLFSIFNPMIRNCLTPYCCVDFPVLLTLTQKLEIDVRLHHLSKNDF